MRDGSAIGAPGTPAAGGGDDLRERVVRTLEIMADRGYNPTLAMLSEWMLGGRVEPSELAARLPGLEGVRTEDGFVYLEGKRYVDACKRRVEAHGRFEPIYMEIAKEYTRDLVRLCPWVRCVMLVGSVATGGLCEGDDLDLNLVVEDGRKFSTLMRGSLLNRKYALRYGSKIRYKRSHHYIVPMFMCLNIVWEEQEAHPFVRRDGQMAYELFSAKVLDGEDYFEGMLASNGWLQELYPQMFDSEGRTGARSRPPPYRPNGSRIGATEVLARRIMFGFERTVRLYLSGRPELLERMDYWEGLKRPYGIYDLPGDGGHGP